jgi:hypothetical protein
MSPLVAVGVAYRSSSDGAFSLWIPLFVVGAFLLVRFMSSGRMTWWSALAAVALGTIWADIVEPLGLVGSSALMIVVASAVGLAARSAFERRRRGGSTP